MALFKTYMKLTPTLLLRNNIKLCIRAKHNGELGPFIRQWMASPNVPKTPEEIKAVAEKYNLHPKEYVPHKQEECVGDYPKLPLIGAEARDPFYPWDFPALRRNYCETLHFIEEQIGEDRYAAGVRKMVSLRGSAIMFCSTVLVYGLFFYFGELYPWFQPIMEKQYPKPGVTHYTFEPLH